jgi:hypothetical protein
MIRSLINFVALVGFTLLLPVFGLMAWGWGSSDERLLMKIAFCALSPLWACVWYVLISRLVFYRPASYLVQFLIVIFGYCMIVVLIKSRMVTF